MRPIESSTLFNFSDRARTGVFSVIWPLGCLRLCSDDVPKVKKTKKKKQR